MFWREVTTPSELEEYVLFEQVTFPTSEWSRFEDYDLWMAERGLRIFLLTTETGYLPNRTPVTIGSFNVFVENSVAYMSGFAIGGAQRGFRLSRLLMAKLVEEYGRYEIVCKTNPTDQIMRKVLVRGGFKNKVDRFENKKLWSYWSRLPK